MGGAVDSLPLGAPAPVHVCGHPQAVPPEDHGGGDGLRHPPQVHQRAQRPHPPRRHPPGRRGAVCLRWGERRGLHPSRDAAFPPPGNGLLVSPAGSRWHLIAGSPKNFYLTNCEPGPVYLCSYILVMLKNGSWKCVSIISWVLTLELFKALCLVGCFMRLPG